MPRCAVPRIFNVVVALVALGVLFGPSLSDSSAVQAQSGCNAGLLRLLGAQGANNTTSSLYVLDPSTGAVQSTVGPIGFAVTGLAVHPQSGVLYGVTSRQSAASPNALITVNPITGQGTLVGPLNLPEEAFPGSPAAPQTLADLAFSSNGTLFGWSSRGGDLYSVNIATGSTTKVGESGSDRPTGGGLAFSTSGAQLVSRARVSGTLDTVDPGTGLVTGSLQLSGLGGTSALSALDRHLDGTLFGVALDIDSLVGRPSQLVTINPSTGVITSLGASLDSLDAIAFCGSIIPAILSGSVALEGRGTAPNARWQVPLVVKLYQPSGSQTVVVTQTVTTTTNGTFVLSGLIPGIYDVEVKQAQAVSKKALGVVLAAGANPAVNFGNLPSGDTNNDNLVDIVDFSLLRSVFGANLTCATTNLAVPCADYDGNGLVDILDFSLLRSNFGVAGPRPV